MKKITTLSIALFLILSYSISQAQFNISELSGKYCTPIIVYPYKMGIKRVVFNTLDKITDESYCDIGYCTFSATTTVNAGQTYTISVDGWGHGLVLNDGSLQDIAIAAITEGALIVDYQQLFRVWFDWNKDGTFGDAGSGEQYNLGSGPGLSGSASITVPTNATGIVRMRVRSVTDGDHDRWPEPCFIYSLGESEDYEIRVDGLYTYLQTSVSISTLDFGYVKNGNTSTAQSFNLWGAVLSPSSGNVEIVPPSGFEISTTSSTSGFTSSTITIPYSSYSVPTTTVYVRFKPTVKADFSNSFVKCNVENVSAWVSVKGISTVCTAKTIDPKGEFPINEVTFFKTIANGSNAVDGLYDSVSLNKTYVLRVRSSNQNSKFRAWIDWNNNDDLYDAGEQFDFTGPEVVLKTVSNETYTYYEYKDSITIPLYADISSTGILLRIRSEGGYPPSTPCYPLEYGETQDRTLFPKATPILKTNVSSIDFPYTVFGDSANGSFFLSGEFLSPKNGNITVTPPANFEVSLSSGSGFTSSTLNISHNDTGYQFLPVGIYVRFKPTTANVSYSGNIVCSGGSAPALNVAVTGTAGWNYCIPIKNPFVTYLAGIVGVQFDTLVNFSNYFNSAYSIYNRYIVRYSNVIRGSYYTLKVQGGGSHKQKFAAWFDWNNDGDFDDTGESIADYWSSIAGDSTRAYRLVQIPIDASLGWVRMRVRSDVQTNTVPLTSCGSDLYGECEDYTIKIQPGNVPHFITSPLSLDFGYVKADSTSAVKSVTFTGALLNPASGNFTVKPSSNFEASLNSTSGFSASTLTIPYSSGACSTTIYVRFKPTQANTTYTGSLTRSGGGVNTQQISLSGTSKVFYCSAIQPNNSYSNSYIGKVIFNGINKNTNNIYGGYYDFSDISTNVTRGKTVTLSVYSHWGYYAKMKAWFDWNQDGDFSDAGEEYNLTDSALVDSIPITIPGTAQTDSIRMRIKAGAVNNEALLACGSSTGYECEDYTVYVNPPLITTSATTIDFGYVKNNTTSTEKIAIISGANLYPTADNITITPPSGFEVSLTSGSGFSSSSITVPYSSGRFSADTIYIRFKPTTINTNYSGNIVCSAGDVTQNIAVTGSDIYSFCSVSGNPIIADFSRVVFNTIDKISSTPNVDYFDFTSTSTQVSKGQTYTCTIYLVDSTGSYKINVWFDWNKDGDFYDAGEGFGVTSNLNSPKQINIPITIPYSAVSDSIRMRVRTENFVLYTPPPCGGNMFGKCADYTVVTIPGSIALVTTPDHFDFGYIPSSHVSTVQSFSVSGSGFSPSSGNITITPPANVEVSLNAGSGFSNSPVDIPYTGFILSSTPVYVRFTPSSPDLDVNSNILCSGGGAAQNVTISGTSKCTQSPSGSQYSSCIKRVVFNSLDKNSGNTNAGYSDFTADSTIVSRGSNYTLSLYGYTYYGTETQKYKVWFDWNNDGDFFEAGEEYTVGDGINISTSINIPVNASVGRIKMRVKSQGSYNTNGYPTACGGNNYGIGECEDYSVVIDNSTYFMASPTTLDFGFTVFGNVSTNKTITISGDSLTPDGLIQVTAPVGFQVSLSSGGTFKSIVNVYYSGVTLPSKTVYVRFNPDLAFKTYMADLKISGGGAANKYVTLKGTSDYCLANTSSTALSNNCISRVIFHTIDKVSGTTSTFYNNYTSLSTTVIKSKTYNLSMFGVFNYQNYRAWFDWNQDGDFDDQGEAINCYYNSAATDFTSITTPIAVPIDALTGTTRMRIRTGGDSYTNLNPCGSVLSGECEDYTIEIIDLVPSIAADPSPLNFGYVPVTAWGASAEQSFTLTADALLGSSGTILVTPPLNFEISLSSGSGFTPYSFSINYTGDTIGSTLVYVRFKPTASNTNYSGNITCSGGGAFKSVAVSGTSTCMPTTNNNGSMGIQRVVFNTIDNNTGTVNNGYSDFTAIKTGVCRGQYYNLSVYGWGQTQSYGTWFDWNNDGDFDDAGEALGVGTISIPLNAAIGNIRMRVRSDYYGSIPTACGPVELGETEDYTVEVSTLDVNPVYLDFGFASTASVSAEKTVVVSGTFPAPASGNVIITPPANFEVSLTSGSGFSSSPINVTYSGGGLAPTTIYARFKPTLSDTNFTASIICSGGLASRSIQVVGTSKCTPTSSVTGIMGIQQVVFNTINNNTGTNYKAYNDFSSISTRVNHGQSYTLNIYSANYYQKYRAWFDWNSNGSFLDVGEQFDIGSGTSIDASASITIPVTATLGNIKMRIRSEYYTYNAPEACGAVSMGECEDYSLTLFSMVATPDSLAFGYTTIDSTSTEKEFVLSGQSLSPASGNISVTPPANFEISLTSGSGYSTSPISVAYSSGALVATNIYARFKPTAATAYSANITCSGAGANTAVAVSGTTVYCDATTNINTLMGIQRVIFNTIDNNSGSTSTGYTDFNGISTNVTRGQTYPITVQGWSNYAQYVRVWFDWNQDGDFNDTGEEYAVSYGNGSITIPANVPTGSFVMRIRTESFDNNPPKACGAVQYGECEDYTINVTGGIVTIPPSLDLGYTLSGQTSAEKSISLSAEYLSPLSGNISITPSANFEISLTSGSGFSASAINVAYTSGALAATTIYVRFKPTTANINYTGDIVCLGGGATQKVNLKGTSNISYCTPYSSNTQMGISRVVFNTIDNSSGIDTTGYKDFTAINTNVLRGQAYPINIYGINFNQNFKVWFDWNQNGNFTDTGEAFAIGNTNNLIASSSINIPANALAGNIRMRVRSSFFDGVVPCDTVMYGECEDYTVVTGDGLAVSPTPIDFGYIVSGNISSEKTFNVIGNALSPDSGNISITPPANFQISLTSGSGFSTSPLILSYDSGTLSAKIIYVRFEPTSPDVTYSGNIVCSGASQTQNVAVSGRSSYSFCTPIPTNLYSNTLMGIKRIIFNTIDNTTGASNPGYSDFTSMSTTLIKGETYPFQVFGWDSNQLQIFKVWFDWNMNGDFNDIGEEIEIGSSIVNGSSLITIPENANSGTIRMRVRSEYHGFLNLQPCNTANYGECEDYSVVLQTGPFFTLSSYSIDWENIVSGSISTLKTFVLTGKSLSPASGNITVTPPANFEVSFTSDTGFSSAPISLAYTGNQISSQTIYVRFKPDMPNWFYDGNIICSGGGAMNKNVAVSGNSIFLYCIPISEYQFSYSGIDRVVFKPVLIQSADTINYSSDYQDYSDFTSTEATAFRNELYYVNVHTNVGISRIGIWFDYNQDGDFEDVGEEARNDVFVSPPGDHSIWTTIPPTCNSGKIRMRVRSFSTQYGGVVINACDSVYDGECEDYTINIKGEIETIPSYLNTNSYSVLDFGYTNVGNPTIEQSFAITAGKLAPASSSLIVTPPTGFEVSLTSGNGFTSSPINVNYNSDTLPPTTIYLRFNPTTANLDFLDSVVISGGFNNIAKVKVKGSSICKASTSSIIPSYGIQRVVLGSIDNSSGNVSAGYNDFTAFADTVNKGITYTLTVYGFGEGTNGSDYQHFRTWFDWNNDGDFSDSGEEYTLYGIYPDRYSFDTAFSLNARLSFMIPTYAITGKIKMRVRSAQSGYPPACGEVLYRGECEDYSIVIEDKPFLLAVPDSIDFGFKNVNTPSYQQVSTDRMINLSGLFLNPASGNVTLTPPSGFELSLIPGGLGFSTAPIVIPYNSGVLSKDIYVRFKPAASGMNYSGNLVCSGGAASLNISLKGTSGCNPGTVNINQDGIQQVVFNTINKNSGITYPAYSDFTTDTTHVVEGQDYVLNITGSGNPQIFNVWIDWNQDGIFNEINTGYPTEFYSSGTNYAINKSFTISIPSYSSFHLGNVRMRIRSAGSGIYPTPCGTVTSGEAEDYTLYLDPAQGHILLNTSQLEFQKTDSGSTSPELTFQIEGVLLSPPSDTMIITAHHPAPYYPIDSIVEVSLTSGSGFGDTIFLPYTGSTLAPVTVYARFKPTASMTNYKRGIICYTDGFATEGSIIAKGTSGYCLADPNGSYASEILEVKFNTLNSTPPIDYYGHYQELTSDTARVTKGLPYLLHLKSDNIYGMSQSFTASFDWNRDLDFEDAGESYYIDGGTNFIADTLITIPVGASTGNTRMRVRNNNKNNGFPSACGASAAGDCLDYTLNILTESPTLVTLPSINSIDLGYADVGDVSVEKTFQLLGAYLSPTTGNITITPPANFELSLTSDSGFSTSPINIAYTASTLPLTTFFVRLKPTGSGGSYVQNIVCSGGGASILSVVLTGTTEYCNGRADDEFNDIRRVVFNTIDNNSDNADNYYDDYEDFTHLTTSLVKGQYYNLSLYGIPGANAQYYSVWFDWNKDGVFDDASEGIQVGFGINANAYVLIPTSTSSGNVRMRIISYNEEYPSYACDNYDYGDCEDYTVIVMETINTPLLITNPYFSFDCGYAESGYVSATTAFTISGSSLTPANGNVTIAPPANFEFSLDADSGFNAIPLSIAYTNGTLYTDSVYVQFKPTIPDTNYAELIVCSGGGANHNIGVTGTSFLDYCTPYVSYLNDAAGIKNVEFNAISNFTDTISNPGYTYFSNDSITVMIGGTYPLSVDGWGINQNFKAWFDWNRDGDFYDSLEKVNIGMDTLYASINVTIPAIAQIGTTRMRIGSIPSSYDSAYQSSCGTYMGEFEDYRLIVANCAAKVVSVTSASRCSAGAVTIGATANSGVLSWYSSNLSSTSLSTGSSFTTPLIDTTTTYYVETADTAFGCVSVRKAVTAKINNIDSVDIAVISCGSYTLNNITYVTTGNYIHQLTSAAGCDSVLKLNVTIFSTADQNVIADTSSVCFGDSVKIIVQSSQQGVNYSLRDNSDNSIVAGPVDGTGDSIEFYTLALNDSMSFNVLANNTNSYSKGIRFDGNDDYISIPIILPITNLTNEFWFRTSVLDQGIFTVTDSNFYGTYDREIYLSGGNIRANVWTGGAVSLQTISTFGTNYADGNWHHVAYVLEGYSSGQRLYVDGALAASGSVYFSAFNWNTKVNIGSSPGASNKFFKGTIDEIRLWNVARTGAEISSNMNNCLTGTEPGLSAYYKCEGDSGSAILSDLTSNQINASLVNMNPATKQTDGISVCGAISTTCSEQMSDIVQVFAGNKKSTETVTACQNYSWHGNTYTVSGAYKETIPITSGCDSVLTLNLTIKNNTSSSDSASACNSYTWQGNTYTVSGTYKDTIPNITGCDSVLTLNLTIKNSTSSSDSVSACNSYTWQGNTLTVSGTYKDTITNSAGCDSIMTLNLTINSYPTVSLGGDVTQCGGTVLLDAQNSGSTYLWSNSATTQTINVSLTGTYSVTVTNASGCTGTDIINITINPFPGVTTTLIAPIITANQNGATYQWIDCKDSSAISGATNQNYTATATGDYAVIVTLNGCSDTSVCVNITVIGIVETENNNQLKVYPNPNSGMFTIQSTSAGNYSITNELGQTIQSFILTPANKYAVNIENLSNGIYFIIGFTNNQMIRQKVVVTK